MTTLPQTTSVRLPQSPSGGPGAPGAFAIPAAAPAAFQMSGADVWRVIRSNLLLILLMLIVSAAAGYGLNWWLARNMPSYTARGLVQVPQVVQTGLAGTDVRDLPNERIMNEQRTQAQIMQSERLFSDVLGAPTTALRETGWYKQFSRTVDGRLVVDSRAAKRSLKKFFKVTPIPDSSLLAVEMEWSDPKDAKTVIEEIVNVHLEQQRALDTSRREQQNQSLGRTKQQYQNERNRVQDQILAKQSELSKVGFGVGSFSTQEIELGELLRQQLKLQADLSEATAAYETMQAQLNAGQSIPTVERLVDQDMYVVGYARDITSYRQQIALEQASGAGDENPKIKRYRDALNLAQKELDDKRNELRQKYRQQILAEVEGNRMRLENDFRKISGYVTGLKNDLAMNSDKLARLRNDMENEKWWREQVQNIQNKQTDFESANSASGMSRINWAGGRGPEVPENPSFPDLKTVMALSIIAGLSLALGIAFLREFMDDTVRSPRDIVRAGQLNVLGIVADENDDPQVADAKLPIFDAPHSVTAEQFRQVRTRLQHAASLDTMRSIMVTGPGPQDGKTTIAANLAAGLALNGRRILLVDANFRRPEIHRLFGVNNDKGFSDVLNGTANLEDVTHETRVPNLSVLPCGPRPMNAAELFESQLLVDFIERAAEDYDHVIFDSAPFLVVAEPGAMAAKVDGVVTVIRAHSESRGLLTRMRDALRQTKAEHVGVVLNAVRSQGGGYYKRNIKAYYQYQQEA